ncbi:MAG TPA: hypothetical protein VGT40_20800 [Methylomirabilota bacterium]|nr:hypothetical protein [Methylomirabilota bacterium]
MTTADMAAAASERRSEERKGLEASKPAPGRPAEVKPTGTMVEERPSAESDKALPLFSGDEGGRFRDRWAGIQAGFVDDPRRAVEQADGLVAEVMQRLAQVFADERAKLEGQWSRGNDISTEDLRLALRRYRGFFDRLLSV